MTTREGDRIAISLAADGDATCWNDYVKHTDPDGHFYHFSWRQVIQRALGHEARFLIARQNGIVRGILPLFDVKSHLFGHALVSVPFLNGGGILADDEASREALLSRLDTMVQEGNLHYGELRQRGPIENVPKTLTCRRHRVAMRLSLDSDPEAQFNRFKGKLRSQIRRPIKAGAEVQIVNGENVVARDIEVFFEVFAENMRDLGKPVFPKSLFQETISAFKERSWIAVVWIDGLPTAAGLMVGAGTSIEMVWASSKRCFNSLSVIMLLYWEAIKTAAMNGYKMFDFGRSTLGSPTFTFNAQWGATPLALHWYYRKGRGDIPNVSSANPRFGAAVRAWKSLPVPVANCLGPFVAKSLP